MAVILTGISDFSMSCQSLDNLLFNWDSAYTTRISLFPRIWYSRIGIDEKKLVVSSKLKEKNGELHGAALSSDIGLSQEKAKSELVERIAYVHYFENDTLGARLDLDNSSTGFAALPKKFSPAAVREGAICESLERWFLNQIFYKQNICLNRKRLITGLIHYSGQINFCHKKYFFSLVLKEGKNGFLSGAAMATDKQSSFLSAKFELLYHIHKIKRWQTRKEQMNKKNILEVRTQNFYSNKKLASDYLQKLSVCEKNQFKTPDIICDIPLYGIWDKSYHVHRILVSDSESIYKGGIEKMML